MAAGSQPTSPFHDAMLDRAGGRRLAAQGPRVHIDIDTLRATNGPRAGELVHQVRITIGRNAHEHILDSREAVRTFLDGAAAALATLGAVMVDDGGNEQLASAWLAERIKWTRANARRAG